MNYISLISIIAFILLDWQNVLIEEFVIEKQENVSVLIILKVQLVSDQSVQMTAVVCSIRILPPLRFSSHFI